MYDYRCSFYPAYLGADESVLHLFKYVTSGYETMFLQPLSIGCKVDTCAFVNDDKKKTFSPLEYYQRKFKNFPDIEYRYGIVLDLLISPPNKYVNSSGVLIALVTFNDELLKEPDCKIIQCPNPSPQNLYW